MPGFFFGPGVFDEAPMCFLVIRPAFAPAMRLAIPAGSWNAAAI